MTAAKRGSFTAVIYGVPGIGKTGLAANFPDPMFIVDPMEDGVQDLIDLGQIPDVPIVSCATWNALQKATKDAETASCKTVVFETIAGFEALLYDWGRENPWAGNKKPFMAFNEGPKACLQELSKWIVALQSLRNAGKTIVLTGHWMTKSFSNPAGQDYERAYPECTVPKVFWPPLAKWFQNVFLMELDVAIEESENMVVRNKAHTCGDRVLRTGAHAAYEAKNRLLLPDTIELGTSGKEGFAALTKAIKEARK